MKRSILTLIISSTLTFNVLAEEEKYDCNAMQVAQYIKENTISLSMPSSVSNPEDATQAIIDARQKSAEKKGGGEGDEEEDCFTLWGDGNLDPIDWSKFTLPDFDFSKFTSLVDAVMESISNEMDRVMERIEEELNKGICERLEAVDWEGLGDDSAEYFEGKIDDKYGVDFGDKNWWEDPSEDLLNGEMKDLGTYVFDPEELKEDVNSETKRKIKKKDKEFWDEI